ncbi:unnamed protein product [Acanthoscelides obtectus]|uniref:Uncharacterized protein n=1 Tax=Acanthoscelides obtectus TaxID=200917 RepID=A0A9P0MAC0_ACAOB|nr:unnamed protein product [Acanthoscelides obtectus]CAK1677010.1 hypothetical protein AOBTE_LOCUS31063 [Acanthoscelides obtectus]
MEDQEKMEDTCRLCDEVTDKMYSVFESTEEGFEVLQMIKECMPIVIYRTDPLSKQVCESCYNHLGALYTFKKAALETADRQKSKLKETIELAGECKEIELFLKCGDVPEDCDLKDAGTSTEDLTIFCNNCKQAIADGNLVNGELELCTDLHKAIAESMLKNKVPTESVSEKLLRKRKVIPFYHELDDSLCSSLTEFTHATEGSQGFDEPSDVDSVESEEQMRPRKKRKLEVEDENGYGGQAKCKGAVRRRIKEINGKSGDYEKLFTQDREFRFHPLSLLNLALNVINKQIDPEYEPEEYLIEQVNPKCKYCGKPFLNLKLLAVHEQQHIDVEVGEKIDNPVPWDESREDAEVIEAEPECVLTETAEQEGEAENEADGEADAEGESANDQPEKPLMTVTDSHRTEVEDKIILKDQQPMVNGMYLGDYSKEERKQFYQTMRIQGVNKKFCHLCRYTFKDNWAIESHYFSSACYYTCRYCGMRFNKQRHKYDEHVAEHTKKNDKFSEKVYAASKISNVMPKILQQPRPKKIVVTQHTAPPQERPQFVGHQIKVKNFTGSSQGVHGNIRIKEEPQDHPTNSGGLLTTTQLKSTNQAYFCRKCYKVFFRLEEFNNHSANCDYNQMGGNRGSAQGSASGGGSSGGGGNTGVATRYSAPGGSSRNGEVSPSGRPMRNCAKETGPYRDEAFLPDSILKEQRSSGGGQQSFICFVCNTPFPTIYSRNSHMRIHKTEQFQQMPQMQSISFRPQQQMQQKPQQSHHQNHPQGYGSRMQQSHHPRASQNHYAGVNLDLVKQEPIDDMPISMEPMVEIHETESYSGSTSTIGDGAVSITPISKKPKPFVLNSNVMKLVQNNPNISIKPRSPPERISLQALANSQSNQMQMNAGGGIPLGDDNRTYKCSSCWEAFSNKSHLYFHKKNQCEGSRLPCPFCKKRFGTEAEYSSHIYYSHPE